MNMTKPTRLFGRRSTVAVLAVIAAAVATLGLLVAQTSRHSIDGARMNVAGQQRVLSERLVGQTLLARAAPPAERALWRPRIDATVNELRIASEKLRGLSTGNDVIPAGTSVAADYEALIALQDSVKLAADGAADADANSAQVDALLVQQRRLAVAIEHVIDELEMAWSHQVDHLLELEAACVGLLLIALVLGVRLALQPTQEQLTDTMAALAESESRNRAVLDAMPDGMLLTNRAGEIELRNPSALRILGLPGDATSTDIQTFAGSSPTSTGAARRRSPAEPHHDAHRPAAHGRHSDDNR